MLTKSIFSPSFILEGIYLAEIVHSGWRFIFGSVSSRYAATVFPCLCFLFQYRNTPSIWQLQIEITSFWVNCSSSLTGTDLSLKSDFFSYWSLKVVGNGLRSFGPPDEAMKGGTYQGVKLVSNSTRHIEVSVPSRPKFNNLRIQCKNEQVRKDILVSLFQSSAALRRLEATLKTRLNTGKKWPLASRLKTSVSTGLNSS